MKTFFALILIFIYCHSFAQSIKDTLIKTDGTKYVGTLINTTINEDNTGQVQFMTEDGRMHNVPSSDIARMARAHPHTDNQIPATADKPVTASVPSSPQRDFQQVINWSDTSIPHKALIKHRTGIGLTVTGTTLFVGGIIMIGVGVSNNGQTTTTTNGYSTKTNVNIGPEGLTGVLSVIVGLPMMISGIVKLTKSKKMARMSMIHVR